MGNGKNQAISNQGTFLYLYLHNTYLHYRHQIFRQDFATDLVASNHIIEASICKQLYNKSMKAGGERY